MTASASSSRLAAVANQRRRQRKQQQAAAQHQSSKSSSDCASLASSSCKENGGDDGNKCEQPHLLGLACTHTRSNSANTFDDSTIMSGFSSVGHSTITDVSSGFDQARTTSAAGPPLTIKTNKTPTLKAKLPGGSTKPESVIVSTPRRRNLYHAKLRGSGNASTCSATSATSATTASISTSSATPEHCRNASSCSATIATTASTFTNSATPQHESASVCPTPRRSGSQTPQGTPRTPRLSILADDASAASAVSTSSPANSSLKIKQLTTERDRLRNDMSAIKRKLQSAIETKNASVRENDDVVEDLQRRLDEMTREAEASRAQTYSLQLQIQEMERKSLDETAARMRDLNRLDETATELARVRQQNESLSSERSSAESRDRARRDELYATQNRLEEINAELSRVQLLNEQLRSEADTKDREASASAELRRALKAMEVEKNYMESNWKESMERLELLEAECQENEARHAQREAQLEQTITDAHKEKRMATASVSSVEAQLSDALSDKLTLEKSYQDQLHDLQTELQLQRNGCETIKRHHAKIVEGLKADLAKARQLREESASSSQKDMEQMKQEYDASVNYYKEEMESLRCQLRDMKSRAEEERKEFLKQVNSIQPEYEHKLESIEKEKNEMATQLSKALGDIECLKTVRDKDIELLTSELDKTYKEKVQLDVECKDAKRQLHNALRNLDEMAMDGGKMRKDFESVVEDFAQEKRHFQQQSEKEIAHWKEISEMSKSKVEELRKENEAYEDKCSELKTKVASLEQRYESDIDDWTKCSEENKSMLDGLKSENARYEEKCAELQKSVSTLEERLMIKDIECTKQQQSEEAMLLEIQYLKNRLEKVEEESATFSADAVAAASTAANAESELSEHKARVTELQTENLHLTAKVSRNADTIESLRSTQRNTSAELSRAQQTIQILKSKERYLESRVESLAGQIAQTVKEYEMRLTTSGSGESGNGTGGCSRFSTGKQ